MRTIKNMNTNTDYRLFRCVNGYFGSFVMLTSKLKPGDESGICKETIIEYEEEIFVFDNFNYGSTCLGAQTLADVLKDLGCDDDMADILATQEGRNEVIFTHADMPRREPQFIFENK